MKKCRVPEDWSDAYFLLSQLLDQQETGKKVVFPFTLLECEQYPKSRSLNMNWFGIQERYMVMVGVPFYWSLLERGNLPTPGVIK